MQYYDNKLNKKRYIYKNTNAKTQIENFMEEKSAFQSFEELNITQQSISYLGSIAKWSKFLAIVGFIMVGLLVLIAVFAGAFLGFMGSASGVAPGTEAGMLTVIYIIMAVIYFFPILFLYKFSVKLKRALGSSSSSELAEAFANLKSHYKFIGILTIIVLSFYAFGILIVVAMGL